MFELTINDAVYQFKFGMGFLREINKKISLPVEGVKGVNQSVGLRYYVGKVIDGDTESLSEILSVANKGFNPRVTQKAIDQYIEDVDDIEALFDEVIGFLEQANASKKIVKQILEAAEKEKAKQEAEN